MKKAAQLKHSWGTAQFLSLSFAFVIIVGTVLLKLPVSTYNGISTVDALFTSTSAVCVTGLASVDTPKTFTTFGLIVIMLLIQTGGLGIMTFAASATWLLRQKLPLSERLMLEYSFTQGKTEYSLRSFLFFLIKFTFITELIGAIGFFIFLEEQNPGARAFSAIFHAVSAFCNAGFSTYSDNFMHYHDNIPVNFITMGLIIMGGIGFVVAFELRNKLKYFFSPEKKRFSTQSFSLHTWTVLNTTLLLIIGGAVLIYLFQFIAHSGISWLEALFLSVTTRTAGFNTIDIGALQQSTLLITTLLMFIGGSPGSTAGGIKTTTFAILIFIMFMGRNNFEDVTARRRSIPRTVIHEALLVLMFSFFIVLVSVTVLTVFETQIPFIRLLFESVSAFGTVGLSTGITTELRDASKLIIILTMFCGRVGSLTIFSVLINRDPASGIKYAEERVLIG